MALGGSSGDRSARSDDHHPRAAKRAQDLLIGSIAFVLSLPIILGAVLATRLSGDSGPILYRARRVGEGGRAFTVLKLRTMTVGAVGPGVTGSRDPRVTKVGRVLRRLKIDELPQLWNVLRGDMSLVGPRPEDERYVNWKDPLHRKVFTAKPGITGLAQLEYRLEEDLLEGADFERTYRDQILPSKLRFDSYYLDHQSQILDLHILAQTAATTLHPISGTLLTALLSPVVRFARRRGTAERLKRNLRRGILRLRGRHLLALDLLGIGLAICLAFVLRADSVVGVSSLASYLPAVLLPLVVRPVVNVGLGLYQRLWRHASVPELAQIVMAALDGSIFSIAIFYLGLLPLGLPGSAGFPRSFWIVEGVLSLAFMGGIRFAIRAASESESSLVFSNAPLRRARALLYGAGQAGFMMARSALREPRAGVVPMGFLDDDPSRRGERVAGLPVYGGVEALSSAVTQTRAQLLLITMPSAAGPAIRRVTELAMAAGLEVRTVPGIHELLDGSFDAFRVRRVKIEDLIRRPQVMRLADRVEEIVHGRTVLVTGAGGSIGSELARQLFVMEPRSLILLDRAESPLYSIQRELEGRSVGGRAAGGLEVELANVSSRDEMQRIIERSHPHVIFHAAAYKHVPLMEAHPAAAVQVNVGGTLAVLDAAIAAGTPHFVLVSTDKAVVPSSVMGATKRIAEWVVADAAELTGRPYVSVRFGNVLGSTGSVVPIFQSQLENGQALTITHPEMTRYFMTIPEAAGLILEATALGTPGDMFVLDMGEPVRIVDLARDLVRLAGRDPDTVPIVFTGLRPGEKLHEQLYYHDETARPTENEQVMLALGDARPPGVHQLALELVGLADGLQDELLRQRLFAAVGAPSVELDDRAAIAAAIGRIGPRDDEMSARRTPTQPAASEA